MQPHTFRDQIASGEKPRFLQISGSLPGVPMSLVVSAQTLGSESRRPKKKYLTGIRLVGAE